MSAILDQLIKIVGSLGRWGSCQLTRGVLAATLADLGRSGRIRLGMSDGQVVSGVTATVAASLNNSSGFFTRCAPFLNVFPPSLSAFNQFQSHATASPEA